MGDDGLNKINDSLNYKWDRIATQIFYAWKVMVQIKLLLFLSLVAMYKAISLYRFSTMTWGGSLISFLGMVWKYLIDTC